MNRSIRLLQVAQTELDAAIEYYNGEQLGLGHLFLLEVLNALNRIVAHPQAWHPCTRRTRRCMLHRFPYGVIFTKSVNRKFLWLLLLIFIEIQITG